MTQYSTDADVNKWREHITSKLQAKIFEYLDRYSIVPDHNLQLRYATACLQMAKFIKQLYELEFRQIWTNDDHWPFTLKLQLTAHLIDAFYLMIHKFTVQLFGWAQTEPIVLIASGSYGRKEAVPGSDVDALLLGSESMEDEILPFMQQVSEGVFGEGIRLAPLPREIKWESQDQNRAVMNTAVLESRFISGDSRHWQTWRLATLNGLKRHWKKYAMGQCAIWMKKHTPRPDHNIHLPPNKIIKEGIGGLRELHFMLWIGFPIAISECGDLSSLAGLPYLTPEMAWASLKNRFRISDTREQEVMRAYHRLLEIRAISHLADLRLGALIGVDNDSLTVVGHSEANSETVKLAIEARLHQKTLLAFSSDIVQRALDILG